MTLDFYSHNLFFFSTLGICTTVRKKNFKQRCSANVLFELSFLILIDYYFYRIISSYIGMKQIHTWLVGVNYIKSSTKATISKYDKLSLSVVLLTQMVNIAVPNIVESQSLTHMSILWWETDLSILKSYLSVWFVSF